MVANAKFLPMNEINEISDSIELSEFQVDKKQIFKEEVNKTITDNKHLVQFKPSNHLVQAKPFEDLPKLNLIYNIPRIEKSLKAEFTEEITCL